MKAVFKKIRSVQFINVILRNIIRWAANRNQQTYHKLTDHMVIQGIVSIPLLNGNKVRFFSNSDDFMLKELYFDVSDEKGTDILTSIIAPRSKVIMDIGANTGIFSISCIGYNKSAQVYAFEPVESIRNRLTYNCKLNEPNQINISGMLVSEKDGLELDLHVPDTEISYSASTLKEFHNQDRINTQKVTTTSIDGFCKKNKLSHVDFLKIDVEWHEPDVLAGASDILTNQSPLLIIEVLFAADEVEKNPSLKGKLPDNHHQLIFELLHKKGYYPYEIYPDRIRRVEKLEPGQHERNYLFSKKCSKDRELYYLNKEELIKQVLN